MKECDILGGQNIFWPLLHISGGQDPQTPHDLRPWFLPIIPQQILSKLSV